MRTAQTTCPVTSRRALTVGLAALGLVLTACSTGGAEAPAAGTTATPAASSTATASAPASTPASASPSGSATAAGATGASGDERPVLLPAALFEEGGMTAEEFAATPDGARLWDSAAASSFEEALGSGSAAVTYSAEPGTAYWTHVLCPERATGGSELHQTAGGDDERRIAWSEWCGLTASPPVTDTAQPQTLRAVAEDGGPIRIVVIGTPAD